MLTTAPTIALSSARCTARSTTSSLATGCGCIVSQEKGRRRRGSTRSCTTISLACGPRARRKMPVSWRMSLRLRGRTSTARSVTALSAADIEQELKLALLHVFNHQTHHRGQVHCLLTRITGAAPSLDLILYQREAGVGLVSGAAPASSGPDLRAV